jgi:hypothetical protein
MNPIALPTISTPSEVVAGIISLAVLASIGYACWWLAAARRGLDRSQQDLLATDARTAMAAYLRGDGISRNDVVVAIMSTIILVTVAGLGFVQLLGTDAPSRVAGPSVLLISGAVIASAIWCVSWISAYRFRMAVTAALASPATLSWRVVRQRLQLCALEKPIATISSARAADCLQRVRLATA